MALEGPSQTTSRAGGTDFLNDNIAQKTVDACSTIFQYIIPKTSHRSDRDLPHPKGVEILPAP